ncbi:tetratricopeptide repeat protein [Winogradskyella jejuensis]|uniref:Tetratricopeptide repeat-containing protein n=1 Tax=Winogradskyella jejuensis TaxID=1089305 RepID=A0A1M5T147_9FLAO|nr:hypothetical protein [Winogradskyella jejuensis]SHH44479.1 hypothetical protein SAMN05444148_2031 [Winogradskyella jejuensis]
MPIFLYSFRKYLFGSFLLISILSFSQNTEKKRVKDTLSNTLANDLKVKALGDSLQNAIINYESEKFLTYFSNEEFIERLKKLNTDADYEDNFVKGLLSGVLKGFNAFPNRIISELKADGYYDFVNYRYDEYEQTYFILFRLYSQSGLNYHDYRIRKNPDTGDFEFTDIYIYLTGEDFSQTLGRIITFTMNSSNSKGKTLKGFQDFMQLEKAIKANQVGNPQRGYYIMEKIKGDISKDKFFLILKSMMAANLGDEEYLKSLEELFAIHGDDPTIFLNKIDYYLLKGMNYEAVECVEKLKKITEDDFLNYSKANIAYMDENYQVALDNYKYIVDNYEGFFDAQSSYLAILTVLNRNDEAIDYLNTLVEEYDKEDLIEYLEELDENNENVFEDFIKTEAYKTWKTAE